ncbi:MAG: pyrroline-5-carboxylate reductase [Elusimicrobia bacterium]|nr:pyrroline-5-carboxylate reductase [Elusimicrobiota bacterium]
MKNNAKKILFIGCGAMGEAILSSCLKNGLYAPSNIFVTETDENKIKAITLTHGVKTMTPEETAELKEDFTVVIAAVKPQKTESIIPLLKKIRFQMLITIIAGVNCSYFTDKLGKIPVLRVMPNICIKVSKSVNALFANEDLESSALNNELMDTAEKLFSASGKIIRVKSEDYIDRVTAVSGSGPAYAAYFMESVEEAAKALGFKTDEAAMLSKEIFDGAISYMRETGETPAEMRKKVTSPGGTTEKAIGIFENNKLKETVSEACRAAYERARELGKKE